MPCDSKIILRNIRRVGYTKTYRNKIRGEAIDGIIEALLRIAFGNRNLLRYG